jgi:hypothetical protein
MRATGSVVEKRTERAVTATACSVIDAVLPVMVAAVVHSVPSAETLIVKFFVFMAVGSPPAPACRTTIVASGWRAPRSTATVFTGPSAEHHFDALPDTAASTAFAVVSADRQGRCPEVVGFPVVRLATGVSLVV